MSILKIAVLFASFTLFAISTYSQVSPDFTPLADSFNVSNPNAVQAINIPYGDDDQTKQLFHMFLPDAEGTFPLVIFYHGGGFTDGNPGTVFKDPERRETVKYFLENDVAFISVGYRLIAEEEPDFDGVIKCLSDAKRGLQFIRYYAENLQIDPDRIAVMGSSAGGGTSLWLGTRDDMANPNATDPVLRESTRVSAIYTSGSQATYDLYKWETEIFENFDEQGTSFTLDSIAEVMTSLAVENFYGGMDSLYQMVYDPTLVEYRQEVDMLYHLSSDDPPLYIFSKSTAMHPTDDVLHHWYHSEEMYETALAANLSEVKAEIITAEINTTVGESGNEFLLRHLTTATPTETVLDVSDLEIEIYPNPASSQFHVNWADELIEKVEVISLSGTVVKSQFDQTSHTSVDVSALQTGVYLVKVTGSDDLTMVKRLIVK